MKKKFRDLSDGPSGHPSIPFFLYGGVCVFGFAFIFVFLPETHNKTAEETALAFSSLEPVVERMCCCIVCCCRGGRLKRSREEEGEGGGGRATATAAGTGTGAAAAAAAGQSSPSSTTMGRSVVVVVDPPPMNGGRGEAEEDSVGLEMTELGGLERSNMLSNRET